MTTSSVDNHHNHALLRIRIHETFRDYILIATNIMRVVIDIAKAMHTT